jgi:hypothetical protein
MSVLLYSVTHANGASTGWQTYSGPLPLIYGDQVTAQNSSSNTVYYTTSAPATQTYNVDFFGFGLASQFTALSLTGQISMSGSTTIYGGAGVVNSGTQLGMSGGSSVSTQALVTGAADINSGSALQTSGSASVANLVQSTAENATLAAAASDARNASTAAAAKQGTNYTVTNSNQSIVESAVGNYVFNVTNLNLSGSDVLTISAPLGSSVIINISGQLNLSGTSSIVLSGGLTASSVLYNVLGTGNNAVILSGGTYAQGIILAPNGAATVSGGASSGYAADTIIATVITLSGGSVLQGTALSGGVGR